MSYIIIAILVLVVLVNLALILFWYLNFKIYKPNDKSIRVSVLIAARNEESNIGKCLKALSEQEYPKSKVEILVGDDGSTDNTASVVAEFSNVKLVEIKSKVGQAKGKANVLAQLAHAAIGDVFLITDADIVVNPNWIKSMVSLLNKDVGIINGTTGVENSLFQHYEWLYFQGMIKVITDAWTPVTAVGNNMLVTRKAYESTGGYENIPFSVTEDFELFKAVKKNGFKLLQVVEPGVLAYTKPSGSILQLLQQRKRWMRGAIKLPFSILSVVIVLSLYFPALIAGLFLFPSIALSILVFKVFLQAIFIKSIADRLGIRLKGGLLLYDIYSGIIGIASMIYFLLPIKVKWKDRVYND